MITRPNRRLAIGVLVTALVGAACDPAVSSPAVSVASSAPVTTIPSASASPSPVVSSSPSASPGADDWSYEGATGPSHWVELSDNYYACKYGVTQSPIDISGPDERSERDPILGYHAGKVRIVNDGHTIMAIPYGMNTLDVYHISYFDSDRPTPTLIFDSPVSYLRRLQFHVPSEHVIAGGDPFPAEVQFVHQHPSGMFTIVGAMVVEGGEDNAAWAPYIDAMTIPPGIEGIPATIDWPKLLPKNLEAWHYDGSLTTPPCTERVEWIFLVEPIRLSAAQIQKMRAAYDGNARPLQPFGIYRSLTLDEKGD